MDDALKSQEKGGSDGEDNFISDDVAEAEAEAEVKVSRSSRST